MTTPTNPGDSLSRRRKLLYILMLGALTALGPFTVDLYLPAFPALEESLGVSEAAVQLTLTGTTVTPVSSAVLVALPCSMPAAASASAASAGPATTRIPRPPPGRRPPPSRV